MQETLAHESVSTRASARTIPQHWEWLAIAAIAAIAFAIRAWTIRGGLPYVDHPDEPNPIDYVVGMLRTGDPNPHAFQKPSLYVYLLLAVLSVHYRRGLATGLYESFDRMHVTTHLYTTIPGFFLWGRLLTAAIATLTVVFAYAIGRRVWSRGAGLIAALFLALAPFHMRHSQYVTTDVTSGWLILMTFGAALAVARAGRWRDYLAAGAFAGLAAATKYNAGVAALMVAAAHVMYWWGRPTTDDRRPTTDEDPKEPRTKNKEQSADNELRNTQYTTRDTFLNSAFSMLNSLPRLVAAAVAALLGFVAGTPYAALSWEEFRRGILGQVEDYTAIIHGDFVGAWNLRGYLGFFWGEGLGWVGCVALLAGLALLLWRRRAAGLLWLSFVVPYLLLHMAQSSHFNRNMVPVVVLSALPIGAAGAALIAWIGCVIAREPRTGTRRVNQEPSVVRSPLSVAEGDEQRTTDHGPRTTDHGRRTYSQFFISLVVPLALVLPSALDTLRYSARLARGDTRVQALAWVDANVPPGARVAAELRPLPGPLESRWAEAPGLLQHNLAWYRRQGYAYLIASSDAWQQWAVPESYARFTGRPPSAEFGGASPRDMLGPHLVVYATGLAAADAPERPPGDVRIDGARLAGIALGQPEQKAQQLGLRPAHEFKPGDVLGLRTFWSVDQPFGRDFFIFVHVLDAAGNTVAQRDAPPWQGRFPTSSWRTGTLVVDVNDLALPKELAAGEYTIAIGMFDPASGAHPPTSVDGRLIDQVRVAVIRVGQ
jgi:Dolichyl-phosphate-mannose-protein mannosyltransferase